MLSRHFRLRSELSGAIAKNQLSVPSFFFNQFATDIYIYVVYILTIKTRLMFVYVCIYIYICNELIEETVRKLIYGMWESFDYGSSKF